MLTLAVHAEVPVQHAAADDLRLPHVPPGGGGRPHGPGVVMAWAPRVPGDAIGRGIAVRPHTGFSEHDTIFPCTGVGSGDELGSSPPDPVYDTCPWGRAGAVPAQRPQVDEPVEGHGGQDHEDDVERRAVAGLAEDGRGHEDDLAQDDGEGQKRQPPAAAGPRPRPRRAAASR